MNIKVTSSGSFKNTESFLKRAQQQTYLTVLDRYGALGVNILSKSTPKDTGVAAGSWSYEIIKRNGYYSVRWRNSDLVDGVPVVILLQYGHATGNGGYVQGRDFINPAIQPIFDQMVADFWKEVTRK